MSADRLRHLRCPKKKITIHQLTRNHYIIIIAQNERYIMNIMYIYWKQQLDSHNQIVPCDLSNHLTGNASRRLIVCEQFCWFCWLLHICFFGTTIDTRWSYYKKSRTENWYACGCLVYFVSMATIDYRINGHNMKSNNGLWWDAMWGAGWHQVLIFL